MLIKIHIPKTIFGFLLGAFIFGGGVVSGAYLSSYNFNHNHAGNAEDSGTQSTQNERWWMFTADQWTAVFTGALFLSTFALFVATFIGLRTQTKDTRILQRAYLSVEPGGVKPFEGDDERIACDVIIVNAGNLPARNVSWFLDKMYSEDPTQENFSYGPVTGDIVIAPKSRAVKGTKPTFRPIFAEKRDLALPDKGWLYVFGKVSYHDGFQKGRYINFCHRYNLRGARGFEIPIANGRYHEKANRTDEG
jgi:hypothetical protein